MLSLVCVCMCVALRSVKKIHRAEALYVSTTDREQRKAVHRGGVVTRSYLESRPCAVIGWRLRNLCPKADAPETEENIKKIKVEGRVSVDIDTAAHVLLVIPERDYKHPYIVFSPFE